MVMLKCRECGAEVSSDEKARKCRSCNTLFPFECAVCARKMRPPIPDFPVERYFNDDMEPLCEDHYQRQCPECSKWFQADENPGFFLCQDCTQRREAQAADGTLGLDTTPTNSQAQAPAATEFEDPPAPRKSGCGASVVALVAVAVAVARALWA